MANTPPPEPVFRIGGSCVWLDGKIYTAGGFLWNRNNDSQEQKDFVDGVGKVYQTTWGSAGVSVYDPANGWTSSKYDGTGPLGFDPDDNGVCEWSNELSKLGLWTQSNQGVVYDGKFYVIIGRTQDHGEIWCFDPSIGDPDPGNPGATRGRWSFVAQNDEWSIFRRGVVGVYGTKVFLAAGVTNTGGKFGSYDFSTGDWELYSVGSPNIDQCGGTVCNGKLYIAGGRDGATAIYECDLTNPNNGFRKVADLPVGVAYPSVVSYDDIVYILGGKTADGNATGEIQIYDTIAGEVHDLTAESPQGQAPVQIPITGWAWNACVDPAGMLYMGCSSASGSDAEWPSGINPPWFKCDITQLRVDRFDFSMGAEPGYFPYQDWVSEGTMISGRVVTSDGIGVPYASVGFKNGRSATADATVYATTDANGYYGPVSISPESTYCAAWSQGWTPSVDYPIDQTNSGPITQDLELTTSAGINIASSGNWTVVEFSSSNGNVPENLFDRDMDTFWSSENREGYSNTGPDQYVIVQLDGSLESYEINGVTMYSAYAPPSAYKIEYSDDIVMGGLPSNWTTAYDCVENGNGGVHIPNDYWNNEFANAIRFEDPITARYLKISCSAFPPGHNNYEIREMLIHSNIDFEAVPCYVSGKVVDTDGNGVGGVAVGFKNGSSAATDAEIYTTTKDDGTFDPVHIPSGYYCAAWGMGWIPSADYEITGSTSSMEIVLDKRAGLNLSPGGTITNCSFEQTHKGGSQAEAAIDDDWQNSHWWSDRGVDEESIEFSLNGAYAIDGITICWGAPAASYEVYYADEEDNWQFVYGTEYGNGGYKLGHSPVFMEDIFGDAFRFDNPVTATKILLRCNERLGGGYGIYSIMVHAAGTDDIEYRSIAEAKQLSDGDYVKLDGYQFIAMPGGGLPNGVAYVESLDRFAGMRVDLSKVLLTYGCDSHLYDFGLGDSACITGKVATTSAGEKYIDAYDVVKTAAVRPLEALGMNTRFASSSLAQGLFVKLCGTVEVVGDDYYLLNDGGVTTRVYCGELAKPTETQVVKVRGVLAADGDNTTCLLARCEADCKLASAKDQPLPLAYNAELRDWLILGLFGPEVDQGTALGTDYIGELTVRPSLGDAVGDKNWFRTDGTTDNWPVFGDFIAAIDLNHQFSGVTTDDCTAYAHVYVYSPTTRRISLGICTDDGAKVWLNGNVVYEYDGGRGYGDAQDWTEDELSLNQGWNRILVKAHNGIYGYGFRVQLYDMDADAYPTDLYYQLSNPE
jgi:hypothetical protein